MDQPPKVKKSEPIRYAEFQELRLNLPKIPLVYKLRRVYWLLNNLHRKMQKDPTAVTAKQYIELLDVYCKLVEEVEKKGLHTADGRKNARQRVDSQGLGKAGGQDSTPGVGAALPFSVGS